MCALRAMEQSDIGKAVEIIFTHDDDDAEAAQLDFERTGICDQYVFEMDSTIIGVTGFRRVPATENTAWLSWTYIAAQYCRQGHGTAMMQQLLSILNELDTRKIFVKVSNYRDEQGYKVYLGALKMYESLGFQLELTNKDFYDEDEDQLIYSKSLKSGGDDAVDILEEKPVMRFNGIYEIAESEGAYTFSWTVLDKKPLFGKRSFTIEDVQIGLKAAKKEGARKVFLTFPSNLPLIHQPLQAAGFKYVGTLKDYYERGVDEMHFSHTLANV